MGFKEQQDVVAVAMQARIPTMQHSEPGEGKTTWMNTVAYQVGFTGVVTLLGSICDRTDVMGIPFAIAEDGTYKYLAPDYAVKVLSDENSLLFLDEYTGAPPDVQNAFLRLVLDKYMGMYKLKCHVVAACNPPSSAAGGNELSHATAARFMHVNRQMDPKEFTQGMRSGWKGVYKPPLLPTNWEELVQPKAELMADFIDNNPTMIRDYNENAYPPANPNPRTIYDYGVRWLAAAEAARLSQPKVALGLAGCVGEAFATQLMAHIRMGGGYRELIDNPKLIRTKLKGKPGDVIDSFLSAVNENWVNGDIDESRLAQVYDYSFKAGLPVDMVWAAWSRVIGRQNQAGNGIDQVYRDSIGKAMNAAMSA